MFKRDAKAVDDGPPERANESDLRGLAQKALELGEARYTDLRLPKTAPNFAYRTLMPAWTEANQFVPISTQRIEEFAAALRDQGEAGQRDAFVELSSRQSKAENRRARLLKIIIDAINGTPTGGGAENSLLNTMLTRRQGHGKAVRVYPTMELIEHLYANSFGWNILEPFMEDKSVTDILVDSFDKVFIDRRNLGLSETGLAFESPDVYKAFVERLAADMGSPIGKEHPIANFTLSDGARGNATMYVSREPSISIRRPQKTEEWTLDRYVKINSMTQDMADFLRHCTLAGANLITYGEVGSGKTTLLSALIDAKPKSKRIITAEDPLEILINGERHPDTVRLVVQEGTEMRDLVKNALRMRPDVLVVGETRDATAYDLLQALSVGSQGSMSTIHANGPVSVLNRLSSLILLASIGLSEKSVRQMVRDAINIVVYVRRLPGAAGRRVVWQIDEVSDFDREGNFVTRRVFHIAQSSIADTENATEFIKDADYMMAHNLRVLFANAGIDTSYWSPVDPNDKEIDLLTAPSSAKIKDQPKPADAEN
jgi:pilus assembly protein CpaF